MIQQTDFYRFLSDSIDQGGFSNDDVVAVIMPLLEEVHGFHTNGMVAPLHKIDSILVTNEKLDIDEKQSRYPVFNPTALERVFPKASRTFEITAVVKQTVEIGEYHQHEEKDLHVQQEKNTEITTPVYLPDYKCFEIELGHHDAASDIFVLGLLMASLSLHLDFTDRDDLEEFVRYRQSMVFLNAKIHPAIANIIAGMTELDRRKRWKDLQEVIDHLKNYRDYNPEKEMDLAEVVSRQKTAKQNRQQVIQSKLRNRLFDTSRRNRLLYFKPNLKFINLTVSSVPNVLNYKNIDPDSLFFWNDEVSDKISKGKDISLSKYLRFEDNAYLAPSMDRIRLEANKDINEYGFSQLRLAVCFLHWYNLKEQQTEKISSPLLLVPVTLVKKKGVKDQFVLEINDTEAEINPVLSSMLKDLYDIRLPESIQLSETGLQEVYANLKTQIEKTRSGIVLDYVAKPRIRLIHAMAKQTLSQYKRRINRSRKMQSLYNLDYSYNHEHFQPLGLQLFRNYIKPEHSSLEFLINKDIKLSASNFSAVAEATRELYTLDDGQVNPFKWEMDVCSMVLGNFNYKKMSLVRDYNTIIEEEIGSQVFDALFSDQPKKNRENFTGTVPIEDQYGIVQSDATQMRAVQFARKNESYIIQGPPGTGKSQTITNLIADYVARGKKVLFVCEKRAAIDVVYYRLKQQSLDELCCLIHDSQSDKKEFIMNLKSTHEKYLQSSFALTEIVAARNVLVAKLNSELKVIRDFHGMMNQKLEDSQVQVRELMEILIGAKNTIESFREKDVDLPGYGQWLKYGVHLQKLAETTTEYTGKPYFAQHPFRLLSDRVFDSERSAGELKEKLSQSLELIEEMNERLELADIPAHFQQDLESLKSFLEQTVVLLPFREKNRLGLLNNKTELKKKFNEALQTLSSLQGAIKKAAQKNEYWINKLSKTDTDNALAILHKHEGTFFSFLNGTYRRTKKVIQQAYDFNRHQVKPPFSQVVENLHSEYLAEEKLTSEKTNFERYFDMGELQELEETLKKLQSTIRAQVVQFLQQENLSDQTVKDISEMQQSFEKLYLLLQDTTKSTGKSQLATIEKNLSAIMTRVKEVQAFAPVLKEMKFAHDSLKKLIAHFDLDPKQVQALLAWSSLNTFYTRNKHLEKTEGIRLLYHIDAVKKLYREFLGANSAYIRAKQQNTFLSLMARSEMSMAGKTEAEKEEKRSINEGRKILENEFGKSMRYKSIRELATGESGQIIRELKPVWLMSPLSVSDTLPLKQNYFDVVIFDEASQITLEEGIPPVYRAPQTIIVGDEMQMPPSNFFSSSTHDPDDLFETDDEEAHLIALDADSFLTQGARKFPSVMLGWHYRSKHESLIGFSNASFYENQLLTIPDSSDQQRKLEPIAVEKKENAAKNLAALMERPISYHAIKYGVYENRSNLAEAEYIAELIRELLCKKTGLSIGVVAFSMEQQGEIEDAVQRLASTDENFEKLIEEEYKRVDDNQFNGIFFKNLENVQGDERDIIVMSTCYGYDSRNKMIMNFGPINRRGGEKRLNVIFSRAKKHMCVVSSIQYQDIKNEYNEGANYFRKYLQYAELASEGNMEMANLVLHTVQKNPAGVSTSNPIVADQLKVQLESKGYTVRTHIGQSHFKCHLGVKAQASDLHYILGILVDDERHYANEDVMEQYVFKPETMRATGWKTVQVYSKDWFEDQDKVMKRILALINNEPVEVFVPAEEKRIEIPVPEKPAPVIIPEIQPAVLSEEKRAAITRLIQQEDGSNKFWEIFVNGQELVIQYGRINTKGQRLVKMFDSSLEAEREKEKLVRQKLAKGYTATK